MTGERSTDRRRFLAAMTAVAASGLAGCGGDTEVDVDVNVGTDTSGPGSTATPTESATGTATTTETADPGSFPPGRVPMSEVPQELRRRAVNLIEDARGTPVTWSDDATLGEFAHPVDRPDVEGVAYYELAVEPTGFVVCATDDHDAPIPHWNSDDPPLGVRLARRGDADLGRLVWIDRLRYVAEDPDGRKLSAYGNQVPKINGLDALITADDDAPRSVRYGAPEEYGDVPDGEIDDVYEPELLEAENDRDPPEEFSFERWESYDALLDGYEEAYGPLLSDLAERAQEAWEGFDEVTAIEPGSTHREAVLATQAVEAVEGAVAEAVDVERRVREGAHDVLDVTPAVEAAAGGTVSVVLGGEGERETLTYRVDPDAPSRSSRIDWVDGAAQSQTDWAGGFAIQPKYSQYRFQGCAVGCGPVAWAILFGWADRQADGGKFNATWNPRYGLYLEDGGSDPPDAVAPLDRTSGVENVIEEIHGYVNTFCVGNNAASPPWWMEFANQYFAGRTHTDMQVEHGWSGRPVPRCRIEARESIRGTATGKGQTPTIVGKGWMSHYPIAYAYRERSLAVDQVKVNNAWGGHDQTGADAIEWISAQSWFSGEIYP